MPTLQDVANRAGVSIATVSKVLSNTPYVSNKTKIKVLQAVEDIGYRPNLAARALSSGKTRIIGVVFPYIFDAIFKDPVVMHILEGVEEVCSSEQYNLLLSTPRLSGSKPDDAFYQFVQSGYVEGLIVIDNIQAASFSAVAEKAGIPTVVLGYHAGDYIVRSDDFAGGKQMMEYVLNEGHTHIGMISVAKGMNFAIEQRVLGMQSAFADQGYDYVIPTYESDFSTSGGGKAFNQMMAVHPDISAVICLNDRMAIGALSQAQQAGMRVPDDISIVGYDNIAIASVAQPALTTINQKPVELGKAAAELIFKRLNGEEPSTVVLEPTLIIRDSLKKWR